jgi:PHO85 cyclin-5
MSLNMHPQTSGTTSPRSHPYAPSLSSSASSSSSSVFSDAASQTSASSSSTSQSLQWESEGWSSRAQAPASGATVDPAAFGPVVRVSTFPLSRPSVCRESATETFLPPLRTDFVVPSEQRQHPRRSSTLHNRAPPPLVRQAERKVNFVDCLVG